MADLIVIRIHPVKPTDGATFANSLKGLSIAVLDRSYGHSTPGHVLETVADTQIGVADFDHPNRDTGAIVQQLALPPNQPPLPLAAATAAIVIDRKAEGAEYQMPDLLLTIMRDGVQIADSSINYNVSIDANYNLPLPELPAPGDDAETAVSKALKYIHLARRAARRPGRHVPLLGRRPNPGAAAARHRTRAQSPLTGQAATRATLVAAAQPQLARPSGEQRVAAAQTWRLRPHDRVRPVPADAGRPGRRPGAAHRLPTQIRGPGHRRRADLRAVRSPVPRGQGRAARRRARGTPASIARQYLDTRYVSSLRDIRRTYQRTFKALLFARRFDLSAHPVGVAPRSRHSATVGCALYEGTATTRGELAMVSPSPDARRLSVTRCTL
jgi:hypothetical protein